jgi:hypothetical protein
MMKKFPVDSVHIDISTNSWSPLIIRKLFLKKIFIANAVNIVRRSRKPWVKVTMKNKDAAINE